MQPEETEHITEEVDEEVTVPSTEESSSEEAEEETPEEEEVVEEEEAAPEVEDREFDKNPTVLYALVQKKLWKEAIARAKSHPDEAKAFIIRKEKDGSTRWRLLPIHAAIVFKAPEGVIDALLTSYAKSAELKDDQEMLPLHLAFRNGASAEIINLLLLAYPESVDHPDRKGRIPLTLAKNAESPLREEYISALEKGASHYAVSALALARERIIAEQKAIFDAQLKEALQINETAFSEMEAKVEEKRNEVEEIVAEKEKELAKVNESTQAMTEHIASLEAQLGCRSDTERFLATKIAKLEEKVREAEKELKEKDAAIESAAAETADKLKEAAELKEKEEGDFSSEKAKLTSIIEGLEGQLEETKATLSSTETKLQESIDTLKEKQDEWDMKEIRGDAKYAKVEIDWANSQANVAILESQLKKRMENEHLLASQVSNLANRLAESADSNMKFSREMKEFEEQKATLECTIVLLKKRLAGVTAIMESTRQQQMTILDDAVAQEEMMAKCMESHADVIQESAAQEAAMQKAKDEMMAMMEKLLDDASENRIKHLKIASNHGQHLSGMNGARTSVLSCAQKVTENVIDALQKDLNLDTLDSEVEVEVAKVLAERRPRPEAFAKAAAKMSEEAREEAPATVEESVEVVTEETPAAPEETAEVVVTSPKNALNVVTDTPVAETRTEVESREVTAE